MRRHRRRIRRIRRAVLGYVVGGAALTAIRIATLLPAGETRYPGESR